MMGDQRKFAILGGFLGVGKTTLLLNLAKKIASSGEKVGILVNDFGEVGIDGDTMSDYGVPAIEITKGCVCCQVKGDLVARIRDLKKGYNPGFIILETSGVASPLAIRKTVKKYIDEIKTLTAVDGSRYDELMENFRVVDAQLLAADLVLINKIDMVGSDEVEKVREKISKFLKNNNSGAEIIKVSAKEGKGISKIVESMGY